MLWKIYDALIDHPLIYDKVGNRIKFYEYPETGDVSGVFIIIDPLSSPKPVGHGDNKRIVYEYFYQIDVWSRDMDDTAIVMEAVSDVMWKIGFGETDGIDEYDKDTDIFRQAKRFIGRFEKLKE